MVYYGNILRYYISIFNCYHNRLSIKSQLLLSSERTVELLAYFWAKNKIKKYLKYIWVLWCFAIFVAYP